MRMASTDQSPATNTLPLDSPLRTTLIHPLLPDIRVPGRAAGAKETETEPDTQAHEQPQNQNDKLPSHHYNPLTCVPFPPFTSSKDNQRDAQNKETGTADLEQQLTHLRSEYTTADLALKAQEATAREAKRRVEETVKRREEVQRAMDKKVKERDTEMKVLEKYQVKVKASDSLPS